MSKRRNRENQVTEMSAGISVRAAGRRGGRATLENQGTDFFRKIGRKGGQKTAELYGDLLKEFGKRGGRPRRPSLNESVGEGDHHKREAICGRSSGPPPPPEL